MLILCLLIFAYKQDFPKLPIFSQNALILWLERKPKCYGRRKHSQKGGESEFSFSNLQTRSTQDSLNCTCQKREQHSNISEVYRGIKVKLNVESQTLTIIKQCMTQQSNFCPTALQSKTTKLFLPSNFYSHFLNTIFFFSDSTHCILYQLHFALKKIHPLNHSLSTTCTGTESSGTSHIHQLLDRCHTWPLLAQGIQTCNYFPSAFFSEMAHLFGLDSFKITHNSKFSPDAKKYRKQDLKMLAYHFT